MSDQLYNAEQWQNQHIGQEEQRVDLSDLNDEEKSEFVTESLATLHKVKENSRLKKQKKMAADYIAELRTVRGQPHKCTAIREKFAKMGLDFTLRENFEDL